jgi:hypothetical protein
MAVKKLYIYLYAARNKASDQLASSRLVSTHLGNPRSCQCTRSNCDLWKSKFPLGNIFQSIYETRESDESVWRRGRSAVTDNISAIENARQPRGGAAALLDTAYFETTFTALPQRAPFQSVLFEDATVG